MADIFDEIKFEKPTSSSLLDALPKNKSMDNSGDIFDSISQLQNSNGSPSTESDGFLNALTRGLKSGVSGVIAGANPSETPQNQSFLESLTQSTGEVVSDIPGFIGGGLAGAAGGPIASGATAFAAPTLIKQIAKEYKDFSNSKEEQTLESFLNRLQRVGTETGKSALIGAATAGAGKLLPVINKIPGVKKFLSNKFGQGAVKSALELGGLTGGQAAVEGELPTGKQVAQNALLLGGIKAASTGLAKGRKYIPEIKKAVEKPVAKIKELPKTIKEKKAAFVKSEAKTKKYFDILKDVVGERDVGEIKSQFKWREDLANAEKNGKFSAINREEMMYYRQKTGNPNIPGDTYKELSKRLPANAKKFVDTVVNDHLEKSLKSWNKLNAEQKINPREAVKEIYLPGMYEYDKNASIKAAKIMKTKNPFANKKQFLSYNEALQKGGLKPKHKEMISLMRNFDDIQNKVKSNLNVLDKVSKLEKESGGSIIVRDNDTNKYETAKAAGFKPYWDPLLRRYTDSNGRTMVSPKPALVEPEFSKAFQGIFSKDPYKTDPFALKLYDKSSDAIRSFRVKFGPFHYGALAESTVGALGPIKGLRFPTLMKEGNALRTNKEFMIKAARSGLNISGKIDNIERGSSLIDKAIDINSIEGKGTSLLDISKMPRKALDLFMRGQGYLFDTFQPNVKAVTFEDFSNRAIKNKSSKLGRSLTQAEKNAEYRSAATLVNDLYGGQKWETMRFMNNPENRKWVRRAISFPDWSLSAIRQAGSAFKGGFAGKLGRRYWLKYGLSLAAGHGFLKWFNGGLTNDKTTKRVIFDVNKANKEILDGDPAQWYKWPLPDIDVSIGGVSFNPGRDKNNKKLYGHMGKQALEIAKYGKEPFNAIFGKSNPLIQMAFKQAVGGTPWGEKLFITRSGYKYGEQQPWKATNPYSIDRMSERTKALFSDLTPFSVSNLIDKGFAPWAASAFGLYPVSKGLNQYSATPYIEKALLNNDNKQLKRVETVLKNNNVDETAIKRRISLVRNSLMKDGRIKGLKLDAVITTNAIKRSLKLKDANALKVLVKSLKMNGYTENAINKRIDFLKSKK